MKTNQSWDLLFCFWGAWGGAEQLTAEKPQVLSFPVNVS